MRAFAFLLVLLLVPSFPSSAQTPMSNFSLKMTVQGVEGVAPLELNFSAQPSGGHPPLSFRWEFGDGETSREQNPRHTFYKPGHYRVNLTVTDSAGLKITGTTPLEVKGNTAAPGARIVLLQKPDGSATLTSTGSRIYGPLERSVWRIAGRDYAQNSLKLAPMHPGSYEVSLLLSSGGKTYSSSVNFRVDHFETQKSFEDEVWQRTNDARVRGWRCGVGGYGGSKLTPLRRNPLLDAAAMAQATGMAANDYFAHRSTVDGSEVDARVGALGYRFQSVGENIAAGQRSPQEVVDGWLHSVGHCHNLMGDFSEIGLAFVSSPRANSNTQWVQVFGKPAL